MRDLYSNDVESAAYLAAEAEPADYDRPSPAEYAEEGEGGAVSPYCIRCGGFVWKGVCRRCGRSST